METIALEEEKGLGEEKEIALEDSPGTEIDVLREGKTADKGSEWTANDQRRD